MGGGVIQPKAIRFAREAGIELEITAPGAFGGTPDRPRLGPSLSARPAGPAAAGRAPGLWHRGWGECWSGSWRVPTLPGDRSRRP